MIFEHDGSYFAYIPVTSNHSNYTPSDSFAWTWFLEVQSGFTRITIWFYFFRSHPPWSAAGSGTCPTHYL